MSGGRSGAAAKDANNENFPVGSRLIAARHRPAVMAYYRFARAADDIADDGAAPRDDRLARLDAMGAGLAAGLAGDRDPGIAPTLGRVMAARGLDPANASDLLTAFRRDVAQDRYADWAAVIDYCRWSAMPVGRFMLDVHGEAAALRPMSDALCAALQVINHLQDARADYRELGRVYVPADALAAAGLDAAALGADPSPPALAEVIRNLAARVEPLLAEASGFARGIRSTGLACEVAVIHGLAVDLTARLQRDPLGVSRHHRKSEAALLAMRALGAFAWRRFGLRAGTRSGEAP